MPHTIEDQLSLDDTEHQTVFVYGAKPSGGDFDQARPSPKRRRLSAEVEDKEKDNEQPSKEKPLFPALFDGAESEDCARLRQKLYEKTWASVDARIQDVLDEASEATFEEVDSFLKQVPDLPGDKIPTAIIVTGPNITSQELLFSRLTKKLQQGAIPITLRSGDAINLKTVLKKLIRDATNEVHEDEDEPRRTGPNAANNGRKLLNYDLQILYNYLQSLPERKAVVVTFQDTDAIDSALLCQLIELFKEWHDRIPWVILFGVQSSYDLFKARLSQEAQLCIGGCYFEFEPTFETLGKIFDDVVLDERAILRFGPNFLDSIMTRQREHIHSLQAFRDALKYAYMTHFFANPLSILLAKPKKHNLRALIQPEHKQAIRMLPSFRTEIEKLLSEDNVDSVGSLMEDYDGRWGIFDYTLDKLDMARKTVAADITKLCELHGALSVLSTISEIKVVETVELYWYYMAGDLTKSDIINGLLSHIKRLSPSDLKKFLLEFGFTLPGFNPDEQYPDYDPNSFTAKLELYHDFAKGAETREKEEGMTIRNTYGQQAKMQTKVVGQKIELTKGGGTYTDADLEFTERVDELVKHFKQYFTFESPSQFPIELFVYDAKSPYKEAFEARPRHAIERALSSPHDYLGCRCCEGSGGISASQPPTCIVYQLYLNAGNLVNVFDLWSAFRQVFKGDADEDDEDDEEERLLLMRFYQAVADLKMIGAIKPTRRKVDHVSKLMWQGL